MRLCLTVAADGREVDVLVDADDATTVSSLAEQLGRALDSPGRSIFFRAEELSGDLALASSGLLDGMVIGLGHPLRVPPSVPVCGVRLHVVAGPDTGMVLALSEGESLLGRGAPMSFADDLVSRRHARLEVTGGGRTVTVTDLGSTNGTAVDGVAAAPLVAVPVGPGAIIRMGDTLLTVLTDAVPDAVTEAAEPGWRSFLRPPRLVPVGHSVTIHLPDAPTPPQLRRLPVATVLTPLAVGVVVATVVGSATYLLLCLASPLMLLGNLVADRRGAAKDHRRAVVDHAAALQVADRRLAVAVTAEQLRRRQALADAAETAVTCLLPGVRLWERRRTDTDAMVLRVGVADLPATVRVEGGRGAREGSDEPPLLRDVPVPLPLREVGVLGVAGPGTVVPGVLRWLVLQLAAHHAPRDLSFTLLASRDDVGWAFVRWLPHFRPQETGSCSAAVGNDGDTVTSRVTEVLALVRSRHELVRGPGHLPPDPFPAHVVVLDGTRDLRTSPGLAQLLQEGPAVGVYAICGAHDARLLPETCTATLSVHEHDPTHLDVRQTGRLPVCGALVEGVSAQWAMAVARAMAPLRDVHADEKPAAVPGRARLLDLLGLPRPTAEAIRTGWRSGGRSTTMTVGVGTDGPVRLDLCHDGPHALVAGTTGSGKSELLQTMVASLAVANRPEAMNVVLVDYKGGSAFKDCALLPHTVGMVTDLDAHLVERALTSLGAEVKHREQVLFDAGVKDIEDHLDLVVKEPGRTPLPRLLIVVDEFASMARELPDFVTGLVDIAQRGRSLGIHLVLATQRPGGVVSPEIRANSNVRICLRVTDAADSADVLQAPDAARITASTPGRGIARVGSGGLVPFQAGRVGGRRPGQASAHLPPPFVLSVPWSDLGRPTPTRPVRRAADDVEVTDLSDLVGAIREAARLDGTPVQRSPWLDALPVQLDLADLVDMPGTGFAYGLTDLPNRQQRRAATYDPARDGHLLVVGSAGSGRSQLLRTLAASIGDTSSASDVHLFGLDCGNGALLPLHELPHCGAVVTRSQPERAARLLARLTQEMQQRAQLLSEAGYADVSEQRRDDPRPLPRLVLLLDRWEGFTSALGEVDGGRLTDAVLTVLREGAAVGVHAVITGDRSLASGRIGALTDHKVALRLADRGDYTLVGLDPRRLPDLIPPGRAFAGGSGLETQVALLVPDSSGQDQAAALARVAQRAGARDSHLPRTALPFRVDVLPPHLTFEQAWSHTARPLPLPFAMVGVGGDELTAVGTDFTTGASFIVAGPSRSGRSTLLSVMARSVVRSGGQILVFATRPSPLWELDGCAGVLAVVRDPEAAAEALTTPLTEAGDGPVVVLVDDGEALRDGPAADLFRDVVRGTSRPGTLLVLGGHTDGLCTGLSGWQVEARNSRQGILLSPQGLADGDLIGVRLPRSAVGRAVVPGRGWLHLGDGAIVEVATPTG